MSTTQSLGKLSSVERGDDADAEAAADGEDDEQMMVYLSICARHAVVSMSEHNDEREKE